MRLMNIGLTGSVVGIGMILMSGCSHMGKAGSEMPYGDWQLQQVTASGATLTLADSENRFTLSLNAEGTASGQVACNRWNGRSVITDKTLQIESAGSTRKRCHFNDARLQALEGRYLRHLKEPLPYQVKKGELHLTIGEQEHWTFIAQP